MNKRVALFGLLAFVSTMAYAQPTSVVSVEGLREFLNCRHFFLMQQPPANPLEQKTNARRFCNADFALTYSAATKTPIYSAQFINKTQAYGQSNRPRPSAFLPDPSLKPFEMGAIADYVGTPWKITQLTNLPGGTTNNSAMISNTVPLTEETAQIWKNLSSYVASTAIYSDDTVFEVNGLLFEGNVTKIGISEIWVPSHLYKVIFSTKNKTATSWLIENTDEHKRSERLPKPISYLDISKRVPINFMPALVIKVNE